MTVVTTVPGKPKATIVLGMCNSGTSVLAGSLRAGGMNFGVVRPETFENREIMEFHAKAMWWDFPFVTRAVELRPERDKIIASYGPGPFGFKEPLTLFTADLWREALDARFVGTFRRPETVRDHFAQRYGGTYAKWEDLWIRYNVRLLSLHSEEHFPLLCFDDEPERYTASLRRTVNSFGCDGSKTIFDASKIRSARPIKKPACDAAQRLYETLKDRGSTSVPA